MTFYEPKMYNFMMKNTNIQSEVENISNEPNVEVANLVGKFSDYLPESWQPYWHRSR